MGLTRKDWLLDPSRCPGFERSEVTSRFESGGSVSHTETLWIKVPKRYALVNIQNHVEAAIERSGVVDGLCLVTAMHITAGVYINDAESGLLSDISNWIEHLAPFGKDYEHHQTGEDNGDAHLKSYLTHPSVTTPITGGRLDFGTWQRIFYAEFDGMRSKRVLVKVFGLKKT